MRIATWNINGLRARLDFIKRWLEARQPDIVGLQELKVAEDEFPAEEFTELGYHTAVHSQKAWNGVAVVSRFPIDQQGTGLSGQEDMGARLVTAETGGLNFTTVYVPNGKTVEHDDFPRKLAWLDTLAGHFADRGDASPTVLCGDFNVVPDAIDSWRGARAEGTIFHTVEERSRFLRLLDTGLHDLYRERHPNVQQFSWWDYRGGAFHRGHGLRIDFMLGDAAVGRRVREVTIDREFRKKQDGLTPSDHVPVIVDLVD